MRKLSVLTIAAFLGCVSAFGAIDLKESKFTQVVNDVQIISTTDNSKHPATVESVFKMPDVLRTGPASRAELVADDNTITRVGANTIFSFDAAKRTIDLQQGSLLFNSPHGKGGGSIHTAAATAAVLGTTIIVTTTANGGFKILTLEGTAEVKFLKGLTQRINAGQLIFVLPGSVPGPIINFSLDQQVKGSRLVGGFGKPLPSLGKINAKITQQNKQIQSGKAQDTGMRVGNSATSTTVQVLNPVQAINGDKNASKAVTAVVANNATGVIESQTTGSTLSSGGTTTPPSGSTPPPGVPTAPPGTIIPSGTGGYLTPDGFVFTSFSTNGSGGAGPGPTYASLVAGATLTDATLSGSTLDNNPNTPASRVFTQGVQVTIPTTSDFNGFAEAGYFARNLTITTPTIDMSPYTGGSLQNFVFFSSENMLINNSLVISPFSTELIFFAGDTLTMVPGISITGNAGFLEFGSRNNFSLTGVSIMNSGGSISLDSFSSLTLDNCGFTAASGTANSFINIGNGGTFASSAAVSLNNTTASADEIDAFSGGTLTLSGTTPNSGRLSSTAGIFLQSTSGMMVGVDLISTDQTGSISLVNNSSGAITVNNGAHLTAANVSIDSADSILVDSISPVTSGSLSLVAGSLTGNTATIQNTDLSGVGSLNVNAHTVTLMNVALPSSGNTSFFTANGVLAPNPNTGAAVVPGDLNFIQNVTYHGVLANNGQGYTVSRLPVP